MMGSYDSKQLEPIDQEVAQELLEALNEILAGRNAVGLTQKQRRANVAQQCVCVIRRLGFKTPDIS